MSASVSNKIVLASDHAGLALKDQLVEHLRSQKYEVTDLGTHQGESVDYPDYAAEVCKYILTHKAELGILVCGTGVGMCITANKFPGIRAAVVSEPFSAQMSREHNDANVLCMGARVINLSKAQEITEAWLKASFQGGRHANRLQKIRDIENR